MTTDQPAGHFTNLPDPITGKYPQQCPESTGPHSPLDVHGRCDWCGRKVGATVRPPSPNGDPSTINDTPSELTEEYGRMFDPDWDSLSPDDIRWRMRLGRQQ